MRLFLTQIILILKKDLKLYFWDAATIGACALFSLTMLSLFRFAAPPAQYPALAGIALLVGSHLTSSVFLLLAGQEWEWEWSANRALLLHGTATTAIYLGKVLGYALTLTILWLFTFGLGLLLLQLHFAGNFLLPALLSGVLLSLAMAVVGVLASALALHTRFRQLVMFLLYLPLALPGTMAASAILRMAHEGREVQAEWNLLIAFSLLFLAAGLAVFDYLVEE